MKLRFALLTGIVASGLIAGCNSGGGTAPPANVPPTQEQLSQMPDQARHTAANASQAANVQGERMAEMAKARRAAEAQGGK